MHATDRHPHPHHTCTEEVHTYKHTTHCSATPPIPSTTTLASHQHAPYSATHPPPPSWSVIDGLSGAARCRRWLPPRPLPHHHLYLSKINPTLRYHINSIPTHSHREKPYLEKQLRGRSGDTLPMQHRHLICLDEGSGEGMWDDEDA